MARASTCFRRDAVHREQDQKPTRSQNSHTNPNSQITTGAAAFGVTAATAATTGSVIRQKNRQM